MITVNRMDVMNMDMDTGMVEVRRQGWTSPAQWRGNSAADGVAVSLSGCDRRGCTAKTPRSAQMHALLGPRGDGLMLLRIQLQLQYSAQSDASDASVHLCTKAPIICSMIN